MEFETELTQQIDLLYTKANVNFSLIQEAGRKLQKKHNYKNTPVENLNFSQAWWQRFKKRHGYKWQQNRGKKKLVRAEYGGQIKF